MSERRFRAVAPLPAIAGVERDLCIDEARDVQVEVAQYHRGDRAPTAFVLAARRIQAVHHPCLGAIVETVVPDESAPGAPVLVVETHPQGPRISIDMALPEASAVRIAADLAEAVATLHGAGVVHGAIGPEAVVLDALGRPLLMGAGTPLLAALAEEREPPVLTTDDDLRGLGAVLYALLTGRVPGHPPLAPASITPTIPAALNGLVLSLISVDPLRPPPPAPAVAARLRDLAGGRADGPATTTRRAGRVRRDPVVAARREPPSPREPAAPRPPRSSDPRRPGDAILVSALALLVLAGIVGAFAVAQQEDDTVAPATTSSVETATVTLRDTKTSLVIPGTVTLTVDGIPTLPTVPTIDGLPPATTDPLGLPSTVIVTVPTVITVAPQPTIGETSVKTVTTTETTTATVTTFTDSTGSSSQ